MCTSFTYSVQDVACIIQIYSVIQAAICCCKAVDNEVKYRYKKDTERGWGNYQSTSTRSLGKQQPHGVTVFKRRDRNLLDIIKSSRPVS